MTRRTKVLPFDIARCPGNGSPICEQCRRREPGKSDWQSYIAPQATDDVCDNVIKRNELASGR